MRIPLETFAELLAGTAAASSHAPALGKKFPAGDLKHLVAAAYATGHMRIAYAGEDPVAKVSIIFAVSAKSIPQSTGQWPTSLRWFFRSYGCRVRRSLTEHGWPMVGG